MGQLVHLRTKRLIRLDGQQVVGRAPGSGIALSSDTTSWWHALLRWEAGGWVAADLDSSNGTYVNGRVIHRPTPLGRGDTIAFGDRTDPWQLACDAAPVGAPRAPTSRTPGVTARAAVHRWSDVSVHLRVSAEQEHVDVDVVHAQGVEHLAHNAAHELLLVLARAMLGDADRPWEERGWVFIDDLLVRCGLSPGRHRDHHRVRVWIHRLRLRFSAVGLIDAARIVERRAGTKAARLGTPRVSITG